MLSFFFFNDTATTEIYTLSLHDALPIFFSSGVMLALKSGVMAGDAVHEALLARDFSPQRFADYATKLREGIENMRKLDRKSTRLNSSHLVISYAVFCLKKKKANLCHIAH